MIRADYGALRDEDGKPRASGDDPDKGVQILLAVV